MFHHFVNHSVRMDPPKPITTLSPATANNKIGCSVKLLQWRTPQNIFPEAGHPVEHVYIVLGPGLSLGTGKGTQLSRQVQFADLTVLLCGCKHHCLCTWPLPLGEQKQITASHTTVNQPLLGNKTQDVHSTLSNGGYTKKCLISCKILAIATVLFPLKQGTQES